MSAILQTAVAYQAGAVQSQPTLVFDGTSQYVSIPNWTPLGWPFEISFQAIPRTVDLANHKIWATGSGTPYCRVAADNKLQNGYVDTGGTTRTPKNPDLVVQDAHLTNMWTVTSVDFLADGTQGLTTNTNESRAIEALPVQFIGGRVGGEFFHGPIWDVAFTDNSPLQDRSVQSANNVLTGSLDNAIVAADGEPWVVDFDFVMVATPGGVYLVKLFGDSGGTFHVAVFADSHPTQPNRIQVTTPAGAANFNNQLEKYGPGQHLNVRLVSNGARIELYLDGINVQGVNNVGGLVVDTLYTSDGTNIARDGQAVGNLSISAGGDLAFYPLDDDGLDIIDHAGSNNGLWTAENFTFVEDNSRYYPMDEGAGDTIHDTIGGHDGTLNLPSGDDWSVQGLFFTDGVAAPDHFSQGLPYEADGSLAIDINGAIDHYHQGLPFTATGRLACAIGAVDYWGSGSAPYVATGQLAVVLDGTTAAWVHGVPYDATGHVAMSSPGPI